jgi:hypothetical protein
MNEVHPTDINGLKDPVFPGKRFLEEGKTT